MSANNSPESGLQQHREDLYELSTFGVRGGDVQKDDILLHAQLEAVRRQVAGLELAIDGIEDLVALKAISAAAILLRDNLALRARIQQAVEDGARIDGFKPHEEQWHDPIGPDLL